MCVVGGRGGCTLNVACYIGLYYFFCGGGGGGGEGVRILNFTICLGLEKKVAIFAGIGHLQILFGVTFKTDYFFVSIKSLGIFLGIARIRVSSFC